MSTSIGTRSVLCDIARRSLSLANIESNQAMIFPVKNVSSGRLMGIGNFKPVLKVLVSKSRAPKTFNLLFRM